ncbi:NAD-dependent epimerase/dehydratase family protein [Constantimarinum furrinae]|uniref:Dihydroflavonol-4-reductase n=1 Tax=Constantimarinum furrinae TaxID=2562285 RepID=A0A7G8PSA6_9FLAO|nr:NAD-dependent epimerase/dehydratase family protein [Constantimarinum furrinae]QNJ97222.1 dihydroflavonol-4-reductase [Constantimarinum furrinae]
MILVTGGTGLVGSHLLYFLLKDGNAVRAVHRSSSDLQLVKKVFSYYSEEPETLFKQIEWIEADITDIPALLDAFHGVTHVYHAAAYISFNPKHYYKLKKANIEGTANIVNLCLANQIQKLCYVSSVATLGKSLNNQLIDEETAWNPEEKNSVYAITKYGAEMEVWRGTQEGLDAVIVNPGVILGSGDWNSGSGIIIKLGARGIPFYTGGGIGLVDVQDVVRAMIDLMISGITNEKFVLVGHNVTYKDLLTSLSRKLSAKPPKKKLPRFILNIFASVDWFFSKLLGTKRKLLKATVKSLYKNSFYDSSKIKERLNFSFTPLEETLNRVVENYRKES